MYRTSFPPDVDEIGIHYDQLPPPSILLAAQLVARLDELHDLLAWYRLSSRPLSTVDADDNLF